MRFKNKVGPFTLAAILVCLGLSAPGVQAKSYYSHYSKDNNHNWYVSVLGGINISNGKQSQSTVDIAKHTIFSPTFATFQPDSSTKFPLLAIDFGRLFKFGRNWEYQVGIEPYYLGTHKQKGEIYLDGAASDGTYSYNLNAYGFLFTNQITYKITPHYLPFLQAGIGITHNIVSGYSDQLKTAHTYDPSFSDSNENNLAYSISAGLRYLVNSQFSIGLQYRYLNIGKVGLGSGKTTKGNNIDAANFGNTSFSFILLSTTLFF